MKENLGTGLETGVIDLERDLDNKDLSIGLRAASAAGHMLRSAFYSQYESGLNHDNSEYTPFDSQAEEIATEIIRHFEPEAIILGEEGAPNEDVSGKEAFWVIDGIDGTTNFSRKIPFCNFTLAKVVNGETTIGIVYDFLNNDMYFAIKGGGAYLNGKKLEVTERPFHASVITCAPLLNVREKKGEHEKEQVEALWAAMRQISEQSGRFLREFQSGALELAFVALGKLDGYMSSWTSPWDLSAGALLVQEAGGIVTNVLGEKWRPSNFGVVAGTKTVHPEILSMYQSEYAKATENSKKTA